jgi:hypothetical protein
MARPTKHDLQVSRFLGGKLSASQVNRLTAEGLGLPAGASWADYGPALASLTSRGRDLDVAAVRLAAEHGWCIERLRRLVAAPMDEGRTKVVSEAFEAAALQAAGGVVATGTPTQAGEMPETPEVEAGNMMGSARLAYEDTLNGDAEANWDDAKDIAEQLATTLSGPAEPGAEVYADDFKDWMPLFAQRLRSHTGWVESVSDAELVASVQVAAACWHATFLSKLGLGEEDSWRMIAGMAPLAGVLVELVQEVASQANIGRLPAPEGAGGASDPSSGAAL